MVQTVLHGQKTRLPSRVQLSILWLVAALLCTNASSVLTSVFSGNTLLAREMAVNIIAAKKDPNLAINVVDARREDVIIAPCPIGNGDSRPPKPGPLPLTFRQVQFIRGDSNNDGLADFSDAIYQLESILLGSNELTCLDAGDMNLDNRNDFTDPILLLRWILLGADPPPHPGPFTCDVDRFNSELGCVFYPHCDDDLQLISHVLNRITFGPNLELLTEIQTKDDLIAYMEEQLEAPDNYDQSVDEPEIASQIDELQIGYAEYETQPAQYNRIKGELIINGNESQHQLLHVMSFFWNNHFHTQVNTLRQNFFGRNRLGGGTTRPTEEIFAAADLEPAGNPDGLITQEEWDAFRILHPAAMPYGRFSRNDRLSDNAIDQEEFMSRNVVGYWKYGRGIEQQGISAEMESREYNVFRRLAFGSFADLLEASAKSVAMTIYLNNYENTVTAPNENYGREYLELYTLGVNNMYTQRDIEEISKVFTGWTPGWVRRGDIAPDDHNFMNSPEARTYILTLREPDDLNFPDTSNWDESEYVWAFSFGHRFNRNGVPIDNGHDWGQKVIFSQQFGGTDSLGRLVAPDALTVIPPITVTNGQPIDELATLAMDEYATVHEKITGLRDVAKYISSKLIAFFVTDDFTRLSRVEPILPEMEASFNAVDTSTDGEIDLDEWFTPLPPFLPNGRPLEKFQRLDADTNGAITKLEYQEPDLLVTAIGKWEETGGNMREVLRTILFSDEFLSLKHYRAKVKNPLTLVTSTARILDGTLSLDYLLLATLDIGFMGQELYDFADPTGESDRGDKVMHTVGLLERLKYVNRSANPETSADIRMLWDPIALQTDWQLDDALTTVDFLRLLINNDDTLNNQRALAFDAYNASAEGFLKIAGTAAFLMSLPDFEKR